jgi:uncharacterized protein YjbI with pentapeptide repeats
MADEEDLKRLSSGEIDLTQCDFRNANLSQMDLHGRDFSNSHLESASALGADFSNCRFSGAHLTQFKAQDSNFTDAIFGQVIVAVNLRGTDLRRASFKAAHFQATDFTGADIRGADFTDANFMVGTIFNDVKFDITTRFDGAKCLRPLSRTAPFQNYTYENGKLHRKPDAHAELEQFSSTVLGDEHAQATLQVERADVWPAPGLVDTRLS